MALMLDYGTLQNFLQRIHVFDNFTSVIVLGIMIKDQ